MTRYRIESLLASRLFQSPQRAGDRLYVISNLSGHLSLYAMDLGGSVPEPLLPPEIALHNPHLVGGYPFYVFPDFGRILVMLDRDGDERYQPRLIPLDGGYPEPAFEDRLAGYRVHLTKVDGEAGIVYFNAEAETERLTSAFRGNLCTDELVKLGSSPWGSWVAGASEDHAQVVLIDGYTWGDHVLYLWRQSDPQRRLLYGVPLEERTPGQQVPLNAISACEFTPGGGLLVLTGLFSETYGPGYLRLDDPAAVHPVVLAGVAHDGVGECTGLARLEGERYQLAFNIDGCSWVYEATFDESALRLIADRVVVGQTPLAGGVLDAIRYDKRSRSYALSFSTATSPTQVYTADGGPVTNGSTPRGLRDSGAAISEAERAIRRHTRERILGIPSDHLSPGEDASFVSYDGLRISARLYLPAPALEIAGPRPLVYYVHGGPQSQERPDFAWFSMPLIQFLTLHGFAVFVPNVRGSTGYGLRFTKHVDRDWGGADRLDHVHVMTQVLPRDARIDVSRAGVVGRSYGGYMTLVLAARHPDLWGAAVDMFGPYNLLTFAERVPETWKPYVALAVGDPERDREFLLERSPVTYIDQIRCPLFVIQGRNDPRVVEAESRDLVEHLRAQGKQVDYLLFEDEGHDVLKFENRVRCYNAITEFFLNHLVQVSGPRPARE
jgi:pimeloyl-ACP methyl ester carboxylesterase